MARPRLRAGDKDDRTERDKLREQADLYLAQAKGHRRSAEDLERRAAEIYDMVDPPQRAYDYTTEGLGGT